MLANLAFHHPRRETHKGTGDVDNLHGDHFAR
jgi:hypothetical protein